MTRVRVAEAIALPAAFFFDTNILDSLPEDLVSGDLSSFLSEAGGRENAYVPDIVAREWCQHRTNAALASYKNACKARDHLLQYGSDLVTIGQQEGVIHLASWRTGVRRLRKSGLRVLGPPRVNVRLLTSLAVKAHPPFREGDKGFKDSLVVLSMFALLLRWGYRSTVLISKDTGFREEELKGLFLRQDAGLTVVRSIAEAAKLLEAGFDRFRMEAETRRKERLRAFLEPSWQEIAAEVRKAAADTGVSRWTLMPIEADGRKDIPSWATIRRVLCVEPRQITDLRPGPADERTRKVAITVFVECVLSLELETYVDLSYIFEKVGLQELPVTRPSRKPRHETRDIIRTLTVEVRAEEDVQGNWSALEIVRAGT